MSHASCNSPAVHAQPFSVGGWFEGSTARAVFAPLGPVVDHLLALPTLDRLYRSVPVDGRAFWNRALEALEITISVSDEDAQRVPTDGPLIVVANHPLGGVDGLALAAVVSRARPDVKLLGNSLLARIPEMRRAAFFVDLFGQSSARVQNASAMRAALRWLASGGALAMFPAGEVSYLRADDGARIDSEWSTAVARLATSADATVLPVFFHGANSRWFYLAGRMHPALRAALLVRELLRKRGRTIHLRTGSPIPPARLRRLADDRARTEYLRTRTYALGAPAAPAREPAPPTLERIADPEPMLGMAQEIAALPPEQILLRSGAFMVCMGSASELPHVVREIGRLREVAFRAVSEGSGRARDLDRFDGHYQHLIVWNPECGEVVGSYRIGETDRILRRFGIDGLYTSTLFRYDRRLLADIGPALELGRAFVRPEYQRDYSPLLLLWKGIGTLVSRNPRYRTLFGTVSISNDYQSLSQQILARFLYATSFRPDLAERVQPRNPPPFLRDCRGVPAMAGAVARTIADVGALVADIESDGKGVPVLLRQYLKLNARLLGFNVDPAFGGVLDGLMMVDLTDVAPDMLARYMGKPGAQAFLAHHDPEAVRRAS